METNDGQTSEAQGSAGADRSKRRLSRKYRGLTCANCRAKKVNDLLLFQLPQVQFLVSFLLYLLVLIL
jgi:hypothetical protein